MKIDGPIAETKLLESDGVLKPHTFHNRVNGIQRHPFIIENGSAR